MGKLQIGQPTKKPSRNHHSNPKKKYSLLPTNQKQNIKIRNNCKSDHHSSFIASASFQWPQNGSFRGTSHILPHIHPFSCKRGGGGEGGGLKPIQYHYPRVSPLLLLNLRPLSHRISIFYMIYLCQRRKIAMFYARAMQR